MSRRLLPARRFAAFGMAAALALPSVSAAPPADELQALGYAEALALARQQSPSLAAARAAADGQALKAEALQGLGRPSVGLGASVASYRVGASIDPGALLPAFGGLLGGLGLGAQLPHLASRLPATLDIEKRGARAGATLSAVWPLYTGGAIEAVQGLAAARQQEAEADWRAAGDELDTLLAERYFSAQLAAQAARLRAQAARAVAAHDHAAERMLQEGLIAKVERLQARSARQDAERQAAAAQSDAELAAVALARTLGADGAVRPSTPLFVLRQPIEPLAHFTALAQAQHPGLAKVAAKQAQARQLHAAEEALRRPQVVALAASQLRDRPNWAAGVALHWTLYSSVDRDQLAQSSLKAVEQAGQMDAQARRDIALLVERQWRAVENARQHFFAFDDALAAGDEVLRLRRAGLREGASTALELIDAETRQAQRHTERAQAAYQYTQALAGLLAACGQPQQLLHYLARADAVRLPAEAAAKPASVFAPARPEPSAKASTTP